MSGYGLAWSLLIAAAVAVGGVFALSPSSDRPGALVDRMLLGGGVALLVGPLGARMVGGIAVEDTFAGFGGDLEFWFVAAGSLAWAARTAGPLPWRNSLVRLLDVAPSVLLAYGVYRLLCPIRRRCVEGQAWPLFDLATGSVLIGVALAVRFAWSVSIADRLLTALLVTAAIRMALGFLGPDDGLVSATPSAVVFLLASAFLARSTVRWTRAGRIRRLLARPAGDPQQR